MYCDEGKNNFYKLPILIIVILLLLFCKDKDGCKEEYEYKKCKPDYCKIKPCKKTKPVKKQPKHDECEPCRAYKKPYKLYKKPCKPCKKAYESENYGKCIEDMAYYKSCDEYYPKDHKEYGEKKCDCKKRVCREKKHDNFMNGFSLDNLDLNNLDLNNLDIDEKTMKQAKQLMKHLFK